MAEPCTGWAVKTARGLDMRTVGPTKMAAMVNWIMAGEYNYSPVAVFGWWDDDRVERTFRSLGIVMGAKAVEIVIQEKPRG